MLSGYNSVLTRGYACESWSSLSTWPEIRKQRIVLTVAKHVLVSAK